MKQSLANDTTDMLSSLKQHSVRIYSIRFSFTEIYHIHINEPRYNFHYIGNRLGAWLSIFPTAYLSAGTATTLIIIGGETMKLFFETVCGPVCTSSPLTTVEWYLVFTFLSIVLSQLPNLNSIAGISLVGAITAIVYSTMVWLLSVSQQRPANISYEPVALPSLTASVFSAFNALGIIAFAFRGHNLVLEIQVSLTFKVRKSIGQLQNKIILFKSLMLGKNTYKVVYLWKTPVLLLC